MIISRAAQLRNFIAVGRDTETFGKDC